MRSIGYALARLNSTERSCTQLLLVLLCTELRRGHAKVDGSSGCRRHVGVGRRSDSARRSKSIQTIHKIPHARSDVTLATVWSLCRAGERVTLETRCSRAWVDDLTPLVARSRFRRYTYTRSPMRDDPGDRLVLVVQERVTLETSAVVRCAGPEWLKSGCWLVPRAAVRAERESSAGPGGVPIQTDPELVSRAVARRHTPVSASRNRSNDNARSACEVRNGSSTGRFRTYP